MKNFEKVSILKENLKELINYRDNFNDDCLTEFNNFLLIIADSLDDNQKIRFNRIKFYTIESNLDIPPEYDSGLRQNIHGFNQAEALLKDALFQYLDNTECNRNGSDFLEKMKLLKARLNNPEFEYLLAEFICGEEKNSFPYKSSFFLTQFFNDLGYKYEHDGSTRRIWVKDVLLELEIEKIHHIIKKGLFRKSYFAKLENHEEKYKIAIQEFRKFIQDSLNIESNIDMSYLLDLNINIELLLSKQYQSEDLELDKLIQEAKDRFFNPNDKNIALEKIWDAFERIKTYYDVDKKKSSNKLLSIITQGFDNIFFDEEFTKLTKIGNDYRIRHHENGKKELPKDSNLVNYLFFRMLTLIDLCVSKINTDRFEKQEEPII